MQVIQDGGRPIKAWIDGVELEDSARAQLVAVSKLPFIFQHVAVMPDVHWGVGATIGSLVEVAEKFGCHVGGGFRITQDPCDECERLAACPFGSECVTCNPPTSSSAVVHMKAPTVTGMG